MCGVETLSTDHRMAAMVEHINGLPNLAVFEEVEGRVVWRPLWAEQVDHTVNLTFLDAVVDSIIKGEKVRLDFIMLPAQNK